MLVQDIDYFQTEQIPCSSSGYHIYTTDDYYRYYTKDDIEVRISTVIEYDLTKP